MFRNKYTLLVSRICHSPGMPVCDSEDLPEVNFDFCEPDVRLSEIKRLFVALPNSDEFDDWFNPTSWNARLSQDSNDRNAIRTITCIGDKPAPNSVKKNISNQRIKITSKVHTLLITVDEVSALNHAFIKWLGKGKQLRCWYETMGGFMMGGPSGIMAMVYGDMALKRGSGEIMEYQLEVTWKNLRTEDRIESPIFEETGTAPLPGLETTMILYPHLRGVADGVIPPSSSGVWKYHVEDDGTFVHLYSLASDYLDGDNPVYASTEEDYFPGATFTLLACQATTPLQPAIDVIWQIPYEVTAYSMLVYCPISFDTVTFNDVMGNRAWCTPLVLLHKTNNAINDFLVAACTAVQVYSTSLISTIRLTRSHPAATSGHITTVGMIWDLPGGVIYARADPADPLNDNKLLLDLPAGTHTIGIRTSYTSAFYSANFPESRLYFVIKVA